jgi:predicted nucleic acid-binding protein
VKLFLDTSVLLAACHSAGGASRALFALAEKQQWHLLASPWVVEEVVRNLAKFPAAATEQWLLLREQLALVEDVVSLDRILIFPICKDRPVLVTALAAADVLLTLDRDDFVGVLGAHCYWLPILVPADFLRRERECARLKL